MQTQNMTTDDKFLQDVVVARARVNTPPPVTQPTPDDTTVLEDSTPDTKNSERVAKLQARAEKLQAANQARLDKEQAAKDEEARNKQAEKEREDANAAQKFRSDVDTTVQQVQSSVASLSDRIGSVQTVGGIGLLLLVLALLLFTIVQVNAQGDTRLKQFWYMLNGRATLQGSLSPSGVFGGAASGTFGPTVPGPTTSTASTATGGTGGGPDSIAPYVAGYSNNGTYRSSF